MAVIKKQQTSPVCCPGKPNNNSLFAFYFLNKLIKAASLIDIKLEELIDESVIKKALRQLGMPKSLLLKNNLLGLKHQKWLEQHLQRIKTSTYTSQIVYQNLKHLARHTSQPKLYFRLYFFSFFIKSDSIIEALVDELLNDYDEQGYAAQLILDTLGILESDIQLIPELEQSNQSLLLYSEGSISTNRNFNFDTSEFLRNISLPTRFLNAIANQTNINDVETLIKYAYQLNTPSKLQASDFDKFQFNTLRQYLHKSIKNKNKGVNILLHGEPGVGKTELVRTLANTLKYELFDISTNSEEFTGKNLSCDIEYELLQTQLLCSQLSNIILLVDECDDFFHENPVSGRNIRKQHINQALESNITPTIWITNRPYTIEDAYIRRFDIVMEIKLPEPKNYESKVRNLSKGLRLSQKYIQGICQNNNLSIAHIDKAIKVTKSLDLIASSAQKQIDSLLNGYLTAVGHEQLKPKSTPLTLNYDLSLTNSIDQELTCIKRGIARIGQARILLYGPPGTGKSAYAKHLAQELELPLISKKASDLLGSYVGQTEEYISAAFDEARRCDAILLFDEVDSFLNSRENHNQNWETTMVNEMLTQMESFDGIFIATTNFNQKLDHAVARRFDFKTKLDYLTTEQSWRMFKSLVSSVSKTKNIEATKEKLKKLKNLTPGDFSVVARKSALMGLNAPMELIKLLQKESKYKQPQSATIGFI